MKYIKKMLAGTLSVLVALFCALPPAYAGPEVNTATANSTAPSFKTNTDYVIRNMETGLFLRCSSDKLHAAYFGSIGETDYEYYLWQFKPSVGGWDTHSIIKVDRLPSMIKLQAIRIAARPITPALPGMSPLILITRVATS